MQKLPMLSFWSSSKIDFLSTPKRIFAFTLSVGLIIATVMTLAQKKTPPMASTLSAGRSRNTNSAGPWKSTG